MKLLKLINKELHSDYTKTDSITANPS